MCVITPSIWFPLTAKFIAIDRNKNSKTSKCLRSQSFCWLQSIKIQTHSKGYVFVRIWTVVDQGICFRRDKCSEQICADHNKYKHRRMSNDARVASAKEIKGEQCAQVEANADNMKAVRCDLLSCRGGCLFWQFRLRRWQRRQTCADLFSRHAHLVSLPFSLALVLVLISVFC